ncbi:MAG: hypothetical protein KDB79_17000, partial [Acidobacteria bacterium]|nr:hypothetical protein [Acidobacteriota bacterium]
RMANRPSAVTSDPHKVILWAWERPEDMQFIDPKTTGVAFLAQTLILSGDQVLVNPRRQPLRVADGTYLITVTRIETVKNGNAPELSESQHQKIVANLLKSLKLPNIKAIQIDFDVTVSERKFYRGIIVDLRKQLPKNFPFTITALGSWCLEDRWFGDLPIDEAVPMVFDMGKDDRLIRSSLENKIDWKEPLCRGSYGLEISEPINAKLKPDRRVFYFNSRPWKRSDLEKLRKIK